MEKIYQILEQNRLEKYYNGFCNVGVKDERDFIDGINDETLVNMGFTQVEKNRFKKMKEAIQRFRAPQQEVYKTSSNMQKSLKTFVLRYTYPHCAEPKEIRDMDPAHNTVEDLMLRICYQEGIGNSKAVCLYTVEGMPLTDDPFFNTWSLTDRHIENGNELYAIFTPKENLVVNLQVPKRPQQELLDISGEDIVQCHIMLKGDYEVKMDLESDTIKDLRQKLSNESGIPENVLHYKSNPVGGTLKAAGISAESPVHFYLTSFPEDNQDYHESVNFFYNDITPSVQQTQKGLSTFYSTLHTIKYKYSGDGFKKVIGYIRKLSGCNPLAQSLYQQMCKNIMGTKTQKIAIVEGLYTLFRELLPSLTKPRGGNIIEDLEVFENAHICWAYLLSESEGESSEHENYASMTLTSETGERLSEPVKIPGVPDVFERQYVMQKIKDDERIPNCSENLSVMSMKRATDVEKMLLSLPPFFTTFPLWISQDLVTCQNFQINVTKTFGNLNEELKKYPHLMVTPPLLLKDLGVEGPRLVFLQEDNLGVYISKNKMTPQLVIVHDCLTGKSITVNVDELANKLRDVRSDQTFMTTRTPQEAILVLMDSSSSMSEECYDSEIQMKRIDAIKQLFDNFAQRSMAYGFHHVISLVKFDSSVKTLHTFTETLETFKEYIHKLKAQGRTLLYDALDHGISELEKVQVLFPDCRLRIICLTDGNDVGSASKPEAVTTRLINSNITVDAIIVGKVENNILCGISKATGGCCFKPETSKDGLKLFEMETVLSLELRKPKKKANPSTITSKSVLLALFAICGYDEEPEVTQPCELQNKVTVTANALKKKILESKSGRFLEKDKRILEELKSLHCDPHPFCTVLPSESDFTFWKILLQGPPDTPYEDGVFELYCQFGAEYPVKPPLMRFVTPVYHCNINTVGRICHNIFDRNYSAHVTMREMLDAVYGLLIAPEPADPLDSVLAEEYLTSRGKYETEAKKNTEKVAGKSMDDLEKNLVGQELTGTYIPPHLICPLSKKMFVDPVKTKYGTIYERKAIEKHIKTQRNAKDPNTDKLLRRTDLKADQDMKKMVMNFRKQEILETSV
uniref:UBC core domain-containing protein n=2 Tax=Esox lucius TaxID=8010 RepID=A0A3P8Z502_ESOLU